MQSQVFHPCHQILINVKLHLALLYGNLKPFRLLEMSQPHLERKLQCIRDVLDTLSKIGIKKKRYKTYRKKTHLKLSYADTGYSSLRGKLLNELIKTKVFMAQRDFMKGKITKDQLDAQLTQQRAKQNYLTFHQNLFLNA